MEEATEPKKYHAGTLTYTLGGLVILALFLVWGDFTWAMKDRAVGPSATILIKKIGVSDFVYSLIIVSFPNFTNIFLCPLIAYISDRHRGPMGRRIPFLLFTTPFIVAGLYFLAICQWAGTHLSSAFPGVSEHAGQLVFFCIGWVLLDFGTTLASSLFGALVNDVVPREMLGRFFAMFRMVSLVAGVLYNSVLLHRVGTHALWIFFGIGTLYGVGLLSLCLKVKEGQLPPPPPENYPPNTRVHIKVFTAVKTYFRTTFSLGYYRWLMLYGAISVLMFMPVNSFAIQYVKALDIDMHAYGNSLAVTYTISLCLSYFVGMFTDRINPMRAGCLFLVAYIGILMLAWTSLANPDATATLVQKLTGWRPSLTAIFCTLLIVRSVVGGCFLTATASLAARLYPRSHFAQFAAATGIVRAIVTMTCVPIMGKLLDLLHSNYILGFPIAAVLTACGALILLKLHLNYKQHFVDGKYVAPLPENC
ncbi:MAG: MFS transporter [Victivallales bacterium]|nr:MFS transporter [Victivallales bacterium]